MSFQRVKEILASSVAAWKQRTGTNPDLGTHGPAFPPLDGNYKAGNGELAATLK
jgi:hypothetical protein